MDRNDTIQHEELPVHPRNAVVVPSGQVILFEQYSLLRRSWKWVLLAAVVVTMLVGAYFYFMVPKQYTATAIALPPNKSGTPLDDILGGVASSLKDVGLGRLMGGSGGSNGYSLTVLLTSHPVIDSVIHRNDLYDAYDVPEDRPDIIHGIVQGMIDIDVDIDGPILVIVTDTDPERAAAIANDVVELTNHVAMDLNRRETEPITKYIRERFEAVRDRQDSLMMVMRWFMERTKLYDVEKQAAMLSSAQQEIEVQVASQRALVNTLQENLGPSDPAVMQARQVLRELERASREFSRGRAGAVPGVDLESVPAAAEQYAGLRVALEANTKVLALLEPMYEQSRLDEARNIPVFTLLTPASPPMKKSAPRMSIVLASAFIGTFVLAYIAIALVAYYTAFTRRYRVYRSYTPVGAQLAESYTEERIE